MIGPHVHMGPIKTNTLNWFPGALGTTGGGAEANIAGGAKSRTETIHRRIGYDPAPKMS